MQRSLFEQDQKRARREWRTAVKLYEPLVEEGYTGSYSPVCRFVRWLAGDACITEKQSAEGRWISKLYEQTSSIPLSECMLSLAGQRITTNLEFGEWVPVFGPSHRNDVSTAGQWMPR